MFGSITGAGVGTNSNLLGKAELNKGSFGTVDITKAATQTQVKPSSTQPVFGGAPVTGPATFGSVAASAIHQTPPKTVTFG